MAIKFWPEMGEVLVCDFGSGFIPPEMVKRRPVVVIQPKRGSGARAVTIVPLSTTPPNTANLWDAKLYVSLPFPYDKSECCWAKCDMIYTVSFDRLDLFKKGKDASGKRIYDHVRLDGGQMTAVRKAVLFGMGFMDQAKNYC